MFDGGLFDPAAWSDSIFFGVILVPEMLVRWIGMEQDRISGRRILVVEDDPSARESMKLLLTIDRHIVTEAEDGKEALDLVSRQPFDLVLLDYAMPGMQGREVALNIRRIAPALPILMVTAYLEKLSGIDKPVNAVLGKPFAVDELRSAIAKLMCQETVIERNRPAIRRVKLPRKAPDNPPRR